jgi:hypothetical protein
MTDDPPAIVTDVGEVATSLEEQKEDLQDFRVTIEEYADRVENMNETERSAFYDSAESLQETVEGATTVDAVLELEGEVEAAIRTPLERVATESLEQFLDEVEPELTESTRTDIFERLAGRIPEDLETAAETYQTLTPRVRDLPAHLRDSLATYLEQTPSDLLTPDRDVEPQVEKLEQRYEQLQRLDVVFEETSDWTPSITFSTTDRFYHDLDETVPVDRIKASLDTIQAKTRTMSDAELPVESSVTSALEETLSNASVVDIASAVREAEEKVTSVTEAYESVDQYIDTLDTFGTEQDLFEEEIDNLLAHHRQLQIGPYDSLEDLESSINELSTEISQLIDTVQTRLKAQQNMVSTLDSEEDDDRPEINLGAGGPVLRVHVEENILQALTDCKAHDEWIAKQLDTSDQDVDRDELLDIWLDLSEGEEVALTGEHEDAILAMADRLPLSVVLRDN